MSTMPLPSPSFSKPHSDTPLQHQAVGVSSASIQDVVQPHMAQAGSAAELLGASRAALCCRSCCCCVTLAMQSTAQEAFGPATDWCKTHSLAGLYVSVVQPVTLVGAQHVHALLLVHQHELAGREAAAAAGGRDIEAQVARLQHLQHATPKLRSTCVTR